MEPHVDESEDPPIDGTEDPDNFIQRSPSNGDITARYDDDGASSSQGTQDAEQDHQGGLVDLNEQPVEPNGQDEPNPGGAQEDGGEGAAAGGGGLDLNYLEGAEQYVIMDALPLDGLPELDGLPLDGLPPDTDPFEQLILMMVDTIHEHHQFRGPYVG